jgi:subtilisin family serine protease
MKYLIVRKRTSTIEVLGPGEPELPLEITSQDLKDPGPEIRELRRDPSVDVILSIPLTLIKPFTTALPEPIPDVAWGIKKVGAASNGQDRNDVTVAVLDTGIERTHPAFSGVHLELVDFTVNASRVDGSAPDADGHGTHVAGTIFGRDVNGTQIGVAPKVRRALIAKVLGPGGGSIDTVSRAIDWALKRGADVITMSLGLNIPGTVTQIMQDGYPLEIAVSKALEAYRSTARLLDTLGRLVKERTEQAGRGALLVAACGNESRRNVDPRFTVAAALPAAGEGFISVGAVSHDDKVAYFSNTGCAVAAPGVDIVSAGLGGGLRSMSGTSMAAPHVAGVIALYTQELFRDGKRPAKWAERVWDEVKSKVKRGPVPLDNDIGLGIVQAS